MDESRETRQPQPAAERWLGTHEFAIAEGISDRYARMTLSCALDGRTWRGRELTVRMVPSRGGLSGLALQVLSDSLAGSPCTLPAVPRADTSPQATAPGTEQGRTIATWRHRIIRQALQHLSGSPGRARAVEDAAKVERDHPTGRRKRVSERQLYEWIALYEAKGFAGLIPGRRVDRRKSRCFVTRTWDRAVPFDDDTRAQIAAKLQRRVRSLWARNTEPGWKWIARLARKHLVELTTEAGFTPDAGELRRICKLSHHMVNQSRKYRAVAIYDHDAKRWHDEHRPRIRRTREGWLPMGLVFGDVHPQDVLLPRPDGSTFTARLVAFSDWSNNRIFIYPVFLGPGEGVRQEHIIEAIVAMAQDPRWGVPQVLYLDNGKEYIALDLIADALKLTTQVRALHADDEALAELPGKDRAIRRAQPYNASAKPIEGLFAVLESGVFSMLPGWIGGNRMANKTANVGKAPVPYPHGQEAFLADLRTAIEAYETNPQSGELDGRSPREAFNAAVAAGWKAVMAKPETMLAAFARDASGTVRQGAFKHKGKRYTHRAIQALPKGTALHIRVPLWGDRSAIPVMDEDGSLLCVATLDRRYHPLDREGAREAGRRHAAARQGVKKLRADTEPLDMRRELAELVAAEEPAAIPESLGTIRGSEADEAIGRELARTPAQRRAAEEDTDRISRERTREARARFLEKTRAAG